MDLILLIEKIEVMDFDLKPTFKVEVKHGAVTMIDCLIIAVGC